MKLSLLTKLGAGSALVAALLVGTQASALMLDTSTNVTGSVSGSNASSTTNANVDLNVGAAASSSSGSNTGAGSSSANTSATVTVISASSIDSSADLSVNSSADVRTTDNLNSYARNVVKANADIREVSLSDAEVSVSHKVRAYIFGFVPARVTAKATVLANGNVEVKMPWYVFGSAKRVELEAKVKDALSASMPKAQTDASASAELSAQTQAMIVEKVSAAMKAQLDAEASQ